MKQVTHKRSKPSKPARGVTFLPSPSAQTHSHNSLSTSMPHVDPLPAPRAGTLLAINKSYNLSFSLTNKLISYNLVTKLINLVNKLKRLLLFKSKSLFSKITLVNLVIITKVTNLVTEYFTKVIETYRDLYIPLEVLDNKYDKYISHKYSNQILNSYSKSTSSKKRVLNKKTTRRINNKNSNSLKCNHTEEL
ncbi:MAG: hypothetical protein ABIK73_06090 [candidate division WOR-3 bacterium]